MCSRTRLTSWQESLWKQPLQVHSKMTEERFVLLNGSSSSSRGKWEQEVAGEGLGVIGDEQISEEVAVDKESMLW